MQLALWGLAMPALAGAAEPGSVTDRGAWLVTGLVAVGVGLAAWGWTRRATRRALRNADQMAALLRSADCLLWEADVEMGKDDWRWQVSMQETGLSRRLFDGGPAPRVKGLWNPLQVAEQAEMDARARAALAGGLPGYEQVFHLEKNGQTIWLSEQTTITPLGGKRFHLVGLVTDVTSRRTAELAQRASEERVRQLLARSDCMLWHADVSYDEAQGFHWEWFIPPSELYRRIGGDHPVPHRMPWDASMVPEFAEIKARSRAAMQQDQPGYEQEFRVVLHDAVLWVHEQVTVRRRAPNRWMLEGVVIDITAQRAAEESKRASEEQLQRVLDVADFLLWHARVFEGEGGKLQWILNVPSSTLYRRLFGRDPSEPYELLPWYDFVSADVYAEMTARAHGAILSGAERYEQELCGQRDGQVIWVHEQATVRRTGKGEWQLVGIVTDVTLRHQAEQARQASDRALREILERADCLLWRATVVRQGERVDWKNFNLPNSRLCVRLLGREIGPDAGQLWREMEVPDLVDMNRRSHEALVSGATGYEQEFRAVRGERTFWLHERVSILPVGGDEWRLVGVVTDVTERHEAQEAQRRSDARMEELLRRADCMIWQGQVTRDESGRLNWQLYAPKSQLHRRIFGREPDGHSFAWSEVGVPEVPQMKVTAEAAIAAGAAGYEQVFHVPRPVGDLWLTEQVTLKATGPEQWEAIGLIMDITARHEAEEAQRATEAKLQRIHALADCMVWEANVQESGPERMDWEFYMPRSVLYRRLFGDDDPETRFGWQRLNVPELAEMERRAAQAIRTRAPGYEQEFRVVLAHGVVWLREVVTITTLGAGRVQLVGVITDISAQREAQEAKKASEAQLEQMLATADCLLWQARVFEVAPGSLRWVMFVPKSRLYREIFGYDPQDPPALDWPAVTDEATNNEINARAVEALMAGRTGYEQEFRAQRGDRTFWVHEQATIVTLGPGEWQLVGVMTDLTARRAAEQAVRASELRYRTLFQHLPVAIVEADFSAVGHWLDELRAAGVTDLAAHFGADLRGVARAAQRVRVVDCNDTAVRMFRATSKRDLRWRRGLLGTPDALSMIKRAMLRLWGGLNTLEAEIEVRDFDGELHDLHVRWWMERTEAGLEYRQAVMVFVDLTELKRAEAALAAEKERLAVTLRAMAEGVITTDVEGHVQFMNPAAAAFTHWDPAVAIGHAVGEVCAMTNDRTGELVEVPVPRVAQGDVVLELPPRTKLGAQDGAGRLVEGCCAPIHSANSTVIGTVLVFRDVTEHERLEQELVRATKLESVGILAGGIAHDFNNILTAIMGNVAMAALDVDPQTDTGRSLREAEKATLRARDLTQQLLTFAKGGEPVRAAVQLDGIVREMTTFTLHGSRVKAVYELPADLWPADVDKGQIGRVVQNLVLNAVQAMPEGGTVRLTLRNERVSGLTGLALAPGQYIQIAIADTGAGIRPEHLPRIFDPYFTTKQMGSGLGLAAVYSIVHKHRGLIDVESQLGAGTTFRIWLPASQDAVDSAAPQQAVAPAVAMHGRVLFMDDEEAIRQMASFLLRRFGFEVVPAADGAEAVQKYRDAQKDGNPFALVIMDLTVPGGMGGREAIAQLRALDPKVRAIVSSGYSSDPVLANFREHGFCGVAAKPYEMADLARVLREALTGPAAG